MKKSQNYNLRLPERVAERNDPADIDDLTYDMEAIDRELARQKRADEDLEKLKAGKAELNAHSSAAVLAHPDGSVTDEKLGSRAMGSVRDKLQRLLELVGEQLAAIQGTEQWNDTPAADLAGARRSMDAFAAHAADKTNPHGVTKAQVGLGNVPNAATNDQTPTYTEADALAPLSSGEKMGAAMGKLAKAVTDLIAHMANKANPHGVTKAQVGLGSVTDDAQVKRSELGKAGGVATLDAAGTVPAAQLPSFVDDVLEYPAAEQFPDVGESGKIYVSLEDNLTWRWSGTGYVEISKSLALGETAATAYAGDKGKAVATELAETKSVVAANTAARHGHENKGVLDGLTAALVKAWSEAIQTLRVGTVASGAVASASITKTGSEAVLDLTLPFGAQGPKGDKGEKGDTGATGPQGEQGERGETGLPGPNTVTGATTTSGFTNGHVLYNDNGKVGAKALPTALKNPAGLTIRLNGVSQGAYDGSAAKAVDVTPASLGIRKYAAALELAGWARQADGSYTQTAACEGMTAQVVIWDVRAQPGATTAENLAIAEALGCITMAESLEGQVAVTCGDSCPDVELTAVFLEV